MCGSIPVLVSPVSITKVEVDQHILDEGFQLEELTDFFVVCFDSKVLIGGIYKRLISGLVAMDNG